MNIHDPALKQLDAMTWKYKNLIKVSNCIIKNLNSVCLIKTALEADDLVYASQLLHELTFKEQRKLMTAHMYGGPFLPEERNTLRGLWDVSAEDLEAGN